MSAANEHAAAAETEPGPVIGRSARKHRAILSAAWSVFLAKGYEAATMDEIAALAKVSKPTVYKHFTDKRRLFIAVVEGQMSDSERVTRNMVDALATTTDLERDLRRFARQHVADVTDPDIVRLRRIVIAQADRFPELAQAWYANGPERAHAALAQQLRILTERRLSQPPTCCSPRSTSTG